MLDYSVDSEYKPLKAVLLSRPHLQIDNIDNPKGVLHLAKIDYPAIESEFDRVVKLYKELKIRTFFIDPFKIKSVDKRCLFNLIFTRDHFLMTPRGAIMARMSSDIRRGEVKYAQEALRAAGISIRKAVSGRGTFEGADALWVTDKLVVVGVGNRTNAEGFRQIKEELEQDNIECARVPAPDGVLHLLGALQFVDVDTVLIRAELVAKEIIKFLKEIKMKIIMVSENAELRDKQAMNFVTIAPRKIIMPASCPQTKRIYENSQIKIAGEIQVSQFVCAHGGVGCITGILSRV